MAALLKQDYYELLEVPQSGTPQQIERAYRIARITYEPASTATYSIFDTEETASILRRVEEAYATLSDARLRREYDVRLRQARELSSDEKPEPPPLAAPLRAPRTPQLSFETIEVSREEAESPVPPLPPMRHASARARHEAVVEMDLDETLEPSDGIYDGTVLRRVRLGLGIELEEISALTKINEHYLRAIEANDYGELPPIVYVRGFVREFAKSMGLDPKAVAESYVSRLNAAGGGRV